MSAVVETKEAVLVNGHDTELPSGFMRVDFTGSLEGYHVVLNMNKITRKTIREQRKAFIEAQEMMKTGENNLTTKFIDDIDDFEVKLLKLYVPLIDSHKLPDKLEGDPSIWADEWPNHHVKDFFGQIRDKVLEFVDGPKEKTLTS